MYYKYNLFHMSPSYEYEWKSPCHPIHMTEDVFLHDDMHRMYGLEMIYNAMGYLLQRYDTLSTKAIFMQDLGDYYALRILESMHLLISQGKEELV